MLDGLPSHATYLHAGVRTGYEAVAFRAPDATSSPDHALLIDGGTTAIEDGIWWSVLYRIAVDAAWRTTRVEVRGTSPTGHRHLTAEVDGGRWWVNGTEREDLDGCVDIDLESSLVTNTLAVHRLDLTSRTAVEVPAAFVRAHDLTLERIEQRYACIQHTTNQILFDYTSTTFGFACRLAFDRSGLVTTYPNIGRRDT